MLPSEASSDCSPAKNMPENVVSSIAIIFAQVIGIVHRLNQVESEQALLQLAVEF